MKTSIRIDAFTKAFFSLLICAGTLLGLSASVHATGVCSINKLNTGALIQAGFNPRQLVSGDLNNDGTLDMIVLSGSASNGSTNVITVLLNDRFGNFTLFNSVTVNFSVAAVALADFNQDGTLDLAVAGTNSNSTGNSSLAVYYNNGNGGFSTFNTFSFQGSASAIATGDINGDGAPDIALANTPGNNFGSVTTLINNGFGSFGSAGNFSVGGTPRAVAIVDLNGDGVSDIVTVNTNATGSLLFGTGTGNFLIASSFVITTNSSSFFQVSLAVGDLNNDGRPDLAVAGGDSSIFYTLLNNFGTFPNSVAATFANFDFRPRSLAIGQVIGDGNLDVVAAISGGFSDAASATAILAGNGTGTFNAAGAVLAPTGTFPVNIIIGDFNSDGRNDLATANSTSNDVSVLVNNGSDRFGPNAFSTNPTPSAIAVGDFNGDGNLDTATASLQQINGNNLLLSFGNGRGGVSGTQNVSFTNSIQTIVAADLNGDSRTDLIVAASNGSSGNTNTINVFINTGNNAAIFPSPPSNSFTFGFSIRSVVFGDFNNDGRRDLVVTSTNSNSIAILPGAASGIFSAPVTFAAPVSNAVVTAGDFNNDGRLDLAVAGSAANGAGAVAILLGNGGGNFTQLSETVPVNNPTSITSGDFNGDSILDIAVTNTTNFSSTSVVSVALGIGGGRFGVLTTYGVGNDSRSVTAADFNGDSRLDLIVANRASNSVSILTNTGNGNFSQAVNYLAGIFPEQLAVGDFNQDGRSDVATVNRGGSNFSLLTNSCQEAVTKTDYNGEGKSDFAVFRPSNGTWYALSNDLSDTKIQQLGSNGDVPTPGDYDGDGITDFAVFRPSNGTWYILRSSTNRLFSTAFGAGTDIPVANDYDGDGRTDIAVFRPSNGTWYIRRGLTAQTQFSGFQFGNSTDRPVPADYDGDGRADLAVYRDGAWIVLRSSNSSVIYQQFGAATDIPVIGDYDGDGKSDFAVYRGGIWYILQSRTNSFRAESFGAATDRPQPADYDGDGRTDIAVYRPSEGNWYVLRSSDRQLRAVTLGAAGDIPVSSLYRY